MIRIVPAIDLIDGKCVRLTQGDYSKKKIYNDNPLDVAMMFEDNGIKYLHLVDLDGARQKHVVNYHILESIKNNTNLFIDYGGGIKSGDDLNIIFECGADQATIGSVAVTNPRLMLNWINKYGPEKIILGADTKEGKIAVSGWQDISERDIFDFFEEYRANNIKYVLCTDITKDGMLQGTSMDLYKDLAGKFTTLNIIASGGITKTEEIEELNDLGLFSVVIGKALYEGQITLKDLERFLI